MKRNGMTSSLKHAFAFAFCCLCIFAYSQQALVLGSNAAQEAEESCCKTCGSEEDCLNGTDAFWKAYEDCELIYNCDNEVIGCEVVGDYCKCKDK